MVEAITANVVELLASVGVRRSRQQIHQAVRDYLDSDFRVRFWPYMASRLDIYGWERTEICYWHPDRNAVLEV